MKKYLKYWSSKEGFSKFLYNTLLLLLFLGLGYSIYSIGNSLSSGILFPPIFCFMIGLVLFYIKGKDSKIRVLGMLLMFIFGILLIYPGAAGSIGQQAISSNGVDAYLVWFLFIGMSAIIANLFTQEYTDTKVNFNEIPLNTFLFLVFLGLSTFFHELGHAVTGILLCGQAGITSLSLISGATSVGTCPSELLILVALAGPIVSFMIGILIHVYYHENSRIRIFSFMLFILSAIMQLFMVGMNDGMQAVNFGASPIIVWGLLLGMIGIAGNLIFIEVEDSQELRLYFDGMPLKVENRKGWSH